MSKYIYLDQNKWIDLARAYHGRADGKKFEKAKDKIYLKAESGDWKFPISVVHHIETMSALNRDRRTRLSQVISDVSRTCSIQPYLYLEQSELKNAIKKIFSMDTLDLKIEAIKEDFLSSSGLNSDFIQVTAANQEVKEFVENFLKRDDLFLKLNERDFDSDTLDFIENTNKESLEVLKDLEKDRSKFLEMPENIQYKKIVAEYFLQKMLPMIPGILKELNIEREEFTNKIVKENLFYELCEDIPTLNVRAKLTYRSIRDIGRPIHKNDMKDQAFLSIAVPYCDIVVTENVWVHYAKSEKFDEKYNTLMLTSIDELLDV
ncbi:hypothetical protein [Leptospira koniambonensis]|uniref:hypothetical protein n=1 Tax=Leptospira koniambonensis TaxID=2484950 RepID=UPI003EC0A07A